MPSSTHPIFLVVTFWASLICGCATAPLVDGSGRKLRAETSASDDRSRELPPDGAWVRYHVDRTETTEKVSGKYQMKVAGKVVDNEKTTKETQDVTLSYVGTVVENRQPCRWVEVKCVVHEEDGDKTWIKKMLVSEATLRNQQGYLKDREILRAWSQVPDGTVQKLDKRRTHPYVFFGTPGAVKHMVASGEKQDFSCGSHQLNSAQAWHGEDHRAHTVLLGLARTRHNSEYTAWFHPDLPEGFARLDWKGATQFTILGKVMKISQNVTYLVEETGTGAKSELPEQN